MKSSKQKHRWTALIISRLIVMMNIIWTLLLPRHLTLEEKGGSVHNLGTLACDTDETKARFSPCKEIQDTLGFCFHPMDSGLQLLGSRSFPVELGFRIPVLIKQERKGFRIPTAVFRIQRPRIPDSTSKKFQDPGFHKQEIHTTPDNLRPVSNSCWHGTTLTLQKYRRLRGQSWVSTERKCWTVSYEQIIWSNFPAGRKSRTSALWTWPYV